MSLGEKIVSRRRLLGISQEELAERLGVSRQSVSKWELDQAIPEADKIVAMSEIFGVSCDYLLKNDINESGDFSPKREIGTAELADYLEATAAKLKKIAIGVIFLILSPLTLIMLTAALDNGLVGEAVALGVGLSVLFCAAAAGVSFIIFGYTSTGGYTELFGGGTPLSRQAESLVRGKLDESRPAYTRAMVLATALCIISVLPLIIFAIFELADLAATCGIAVLFLSVSVAVYIFITRGSYRGECERLMRAASEDERAGDKLKSAIEGVFWPLVVGIYLAISFTSGRWDISWIIFPVAAALSGCIDALVDFHRKK